MKEKSLFGWHFVGDKLRDGSPIPLDGVWLPKIDTIKLCSAGYHGSQHVADALLYAPGNVLCYCEYRGDVDSDSNKFCAQERRIIRRMDVTELLRYYARLCALSVVDKWDAPDVVLDWLMTGKESLRVAAHSAAYCAVYGAASHSAASSAAQAAGSAAYSAANNAVSAAYNAAYDAALSAASAAYDAANVAARDAAYSVAYKAANDELRDLLAKLFPIDEQNRP